MLSHILEYIDLYIYRYIKHFYFESITPLSNETEKQSIFTNIQTGKSISSKRKSYVCVYISVQSLSCVWLFTTPWTTAHQASLSITNFWSLLKLMSIASVMQPKHLILCCPLLLLLSIFPNIRVFSNETVLCIRWPKYWSFSFNISPSNEYSGLISSRIDWLDLLAVQGTLKSLLQHHSSKTSILQCSAFFIVQLSHLYMTAGKTIALTRWTFVGKVMCLLFIYNKERELSTHYSFSLGYTNIFMFLLRIICSCLLNTVYCFIDMVGAQMTIVFLDHLYIY